MKSVINKLKSDGFTPFCLFGHSRGANDVLLYSSKFSNSATTSSETNIKKIITDSRESKIDNIEKDMIKLEIKKNEIESPMENGLKIEINKNENFLKLPKNSQEISNEKEKENLISTTPRTITTLSSSSLLSDLNNDFNNNIDSNMNHQNFKLNDNIAYVEPENENKNVMIFNEKLKISGNILSLVVEKEVEKGEDSRNDYLLDSNKLMIVVAAPRFNMPKMLTTLFSQDQIDLLGIDGKFEWSSNEKGNYFYYHYYYNYHCYYYYYNYHCYYYYCYYHCYYYYYYYCYYYYYYHYYY